jgi:hypothetical protein
VVLQVVRRHPGTQTLPQLEIRMVVAATVRCVPLPRETFLLPSLEARGRRSEQ